MSGEYVLGYMSRRKCPDPSETNCQVLVSQLTYYTSHSFVLFNVGNTLSTYYNKALGTESYIDYFLVNNVSSVLSFSVLDLETNLSDHRPIALVAQ